MSKRSRPPQDPTAPRRTPSRVPAPPVEAPPARLITPEPAGASPAAPSAPSTAVLEPEHAHVEAVLARARVAHDDGELLARVEVPKRAEGPFMMRCVLPIPVGALDAGDVPIVHASGERAECEPIARRGDGTVELVLVRAWVDRPDIEPGATVAVEIRRGMGSPLPRRVMALLDQARNQHPALSLPGFELVDSAGRCHVVSPEAWRLDGPLVESELVVGGEACARAKIADADGGKSPLVLRTWIEYSADNQFQIELVIANAAQGLAPEADCYDLAFTHARLSFRDGWLVQPASRRAGIDVTDPPAGRDEGSGRTWYELVEPAPDERPHVFLAQQARLLRFVLVPVSRVSSRLERGFESFGFAVSGPWSWSEVPADGPQRGRLHRWTSALDYWGLSSGAKAAVAIVRKEAEAQDAVLASGKYANPLTGAAFTSTLVDALGLAHPDGTPEEGAPGGWRIRPCGTYVLDQLLLARRWTELETTVDRHRRFLLHEVDVQPIFPTTWAGTNPDQAVPFDYRLHGEMTVPWLRRSYRQDENGAELARPVPIAAGVDGMLSPEFGPLARFRPVDDQHYVRILEPAATLAQLTGSQAACFVLGQLAANALCAFTTLDHVPESWTEGQTLRVLVLDARAAPHRGHDVAGRGLYWAMLSLVAAHRFAGDQARDEMDAAFAAFIEFMELIEMPNGLHQSYGRGSRHYDDAVRNGAPTAFRYAQSFEEALGALALVAIAHAVDDAALAQRARARALRIAEALLLGEARRGPGVAWFVGVAEVDSGEPIAKLRADATSAHVETDHVHHLAWSGAVASAASFPYAPAPRNRFLAALLELGSGGPNYRGFVSNLQAHEREWGQGRTPYASHAVGELQRILDEGGAG